MSNILLILVISFVSPVLMAQEQVIGVIPADRSENGASPQTEAQVFSPSLPEKIRAIRLKQGILSGSQNVSIRFSERENWSVSSLEGVPQEIADEVISEEEDIIRIIDKLYPYYGFTGTETLEHISSGNIVGGNSVHNFRLHINNIQTTSTINIYVDNSSSEIQRITGWLPIDRGYSSKKHALSEQEAIQAVVEHLREIDLSQYPLDHKQFEGELIYRRSRENGLDLWWVVGVEGRIPFYVNPAGDVSNALSFTP